MKKIILLALTALLMVGCSEETRRRYLIYSTSTWDILKMNDSTYLMVPKSSTPYVLNIKDKDNCRFYKECKQNELEDIVKQLKEK